MTGNAALGRHVAAGEQTTIDTFCDLVAVP